MIFTEVYYNEIALKMIKFFIYLFFHFMFLIMFSSVLAAQNIQVTNIHSKEGKEQICSICHFFQKVLKQGTSDICIECHKEVITVMGDNTLATHILPMNRHIIKKPLPLDKYSYKVLQEDGHVYIESLKNRLPLFGETLETATLECATCHEPHGESGNLKMLRVDNSRGQLCEICHNLSKLTLKSTDYSSDRDISFNDVHIWPGSRCNICHLSSNPEGESASLVNVDQSRLCESCHKGTITILSTSVMKSAVKPMNNHPIKFSTLDFDPSKINHNIVKEEKYLYVSGQNGKVPIFGESKYSAVAECGTCHEPHGELRMPKLMRIDNSKGQLCRVCHIKLE